MILESSDTCEAYAATADFAGPRLVGRRAESPGPSSRCVQTSEGAGAAPISSRSWPRSIEPGQAVRARPVPLEP